MSTAGLWTVLGGVVLAGAGGVGLIQGMNTRSLTPVAAVLLFVGAVVFLVGLGMLSKGHSDAPPRFCNRCGEIVPDDAATCTSCGHVLA